MTLTPVEIAAGLAAGLLALSKVFAVARPLWNRLPRWLAVALPVVILNTPQVLSALGVVHTGADLTTALCTTVALLLPGIAQAEAARPPPSPPAK